MLYLNYAVQDLQRTTLSEENRILWRSRSEILHKNGVSAGVFIYTETRPIEDLLDRYGKPPTGVEVLFIIVASDALETASLRASGINQLVDMGRISEVIS